MCFTPAASVNSTLFLCNVALTFSVVALAVIVSVAAVAVSSCDTGMLISSPTSPSSVPTAAFVFVVPSATTHLPFLTSNLVTLPFGNVTSAVEAPSEISTGIFVEYAWTFFTVTLGLTTTVMYS